MEKVLLIDGNSLFFKSFYATYKQLLDKASGTLSKNNEPVNALRTFGHLIVNLINTHKNHHILVAFDERGMKTYRHTKFEEYKKNRPQQPDALYSQIPMVREFLELLGVTWFSNVNVEADDIIGIMATKLKSQANIKIITTDRDLLQLVDKNVSVFLSKSGVSQMDEHNYLNFETKNNGLTPKQIPDLKSLMGDSSDNIPGVKGIGEKTAIEMLVKYKNIENIYENIEELTGAKKEKMIKGKKDALFFKEITTIITTSFDIPLTLSNIKRRPALQEDLKNFLEVKNIFNLISKI